MPVISTLGAMSSRGFGEFNQQGGGKYIEDYFSPYLYTGNGSTLTIYNGIGLADTAGWNTYTVSQNDTYSNGVATDATGNVYVTGYANDGTRQVLYTVKYNPLGVLQWQRKWYQTGWTPQGYCITVDSSGNVYVGGFANDGTRNNGIIIKYNSSGTIQWYRKMYTGNTTIRDICLDNAGNIYGVGYATPTGTNYIYVVKIDSIGTISWERVLYQNSSLGYGVGIDSTNNIYVTGQANDGTRTYCIVAKYNSSGTIQWQQKTYESTFTSRGYGLTVDASDNIYVVGDANDGTRTYASIQKFDTSGTRSWARKLYSGTTAGYNVSFDASGNIYVAGSYLTGQQAFVAKYSSSGTIDWRRRLYYLTANEFRGCETDTAGNVYAAGSFITSGGVNNIGCTIKIRQDGTTTSGTAFLNMLTANLTDAAGTQVVATGTATDQSTTTTTSTTGATDADGTLTSTIYTQDTVTSGGGLVWMKQRNVIADHALYDTARGVNLDLASNTTSGQTFQVSGLSTFSPSGFDIGFLSTINTLNNTYISWTWRKSSKYFDVVTYTGNGANRQISHNLQSVPGMIIIKRTDTPATSDWIVYHRSLANTEYLSLNLSAAKSTGATYWNSTTPTSSVFSVGTAVDVNENAGTYVAYLFAHDAGGFGLEGFDNVITCGSYTGNGSSTGPSITLGYEPQFIMIKNATGSGDWVMFDNMRGIPVDTGDALLRANLSSIESSANVIALTSTGFSITTTNASYNTSASTYVYVAIRRGPMRIPTDATTVFSPIIANAVAGTQQTTNFPIDSQWKAVRTGDTFNSTVDDRLRGNSSTTTSSGLYWTTSSSAAESATNATTRLWDNVGFQIPTYYASKSSVFYNFGRAPSFMDVVCYTGTGANRTVTHNLGSVPELMIVKRRSTTATPFIYNATSGNTKYLVLSTTAAEATLATVWNNTTPTDSVFTVGTSTNVNASGSTYVAYLFSSCPGVSKVGTYSGTGSTQTISCGFTGGARYVLIKRIDSTGSWWVWDTARGMIAGTDPRLGYDLTSAEQNANWVYTTTGGFQIVTTDATVNASGGTYIYLAIA